MMRKIWYALRCALCEELISAALTCAPKGYTPSTVAACIDAYRRTGKFADLDAKPPSAGSK